MQRCGSSTSGGTSGRRYRKVVYVLRGLVSCGQCASCGAALLED
jgi:hypothetical protein